MFTLGQGQVIQGWDRGLLGQVSCFVPNTWEDSHLLLRPCSNGCCACTCIPGLACSGMCCQSGFADSGHCLTHGDGNLFGAEANPRRDRLARLTRHAVDFVCPQRRAGCASARCANWLSQAISVGYSSRSSVGTSLVQLVVLVGASLVPVGGPDRHNPLLPRGL